MENNNVDPKTAKQIDFVKMSKVVRKHKRKYYLILPVVFVLSCLLILCVPRYYSCTVKLAPEISTLGSNSLSDLASSFGFDLSGGSSGTSDAILPELYPDLMSSVDFVTQLFDIPVKTIDGKLSTTYYDYLRNHQKLPWWTVAARWVKRNVKKLFVEEEPRDSGRLNPFRLNKKQYAAVNIIKKKVECDVNTKNNVISISVEDQDPLICAAMADSVKVLLQKAIIDYRTNKARVDLAYAQQIYNETKARYEISKKKYAAFADANSNVVLPSLQVKEEDLENDMQLEYNAYSTVQTQLNAARAKVQERTPAFTTLQSATVPLKPTGPKRMIFVAVMTILAFIVISAYYIYKERVF